MAGDKRDGHLIRYYINIGFFKGIYITQCPFCNNDNSRKHVTNDSRKFEKLSNITWMSLEKTKNINQYKGELESAILDVYFNPSDECHKKLEVQKNFALKLLITGAERDK